MSTSAPVARGRWRRSTLLAPLLVSLGLLLLAATVTISLVMVRQTAELTERVRQTQAIVDANVRTLSQTQRELLRTKYLLATGVTGTPLVVQTDFVTQRTHESALSYQRQTLGTERLLRVARADQASWRTQVLPLVLEASRDGGDGPERRRAITEVDRLERSYNQLVSDGEINRRTKAAEANAGTRSLLGATRWLLVGMALTFLTAVGVLGVGGVVLVGVNRKRAAASAALVELNDELQSLAQVVRATASMVVVTDELGAITWVNEAFERQTGWSRTEVVGRRPGDFLQGPATDPATVERMREAQLHGEAVRVEVANYSRVGEEYWVAVDITPLRDDTGALTGFVGVESDVTERHEAELLLDSAREAAEESAREKAGFLATMSHEIRTPLNAVLGLTDLLMLTELDEEQQEYVETANRSGNHLLALVNDILDFSALESRRTESVAEDFSLVALAEECVEMFASQAQQRGVELTLDLEPSLPRTVTGDPTRVRQVLVNVLGNALKFTEEGSVHVVVDVADVTGGAHVTDASAPTHPPLVVTVVDTGIGVPRWRIPSLFESFSRGDVSTTRKYGGTGLGLAICRRLVEAMGGTIGLESELGEGTRVTVVLPLPWADDQQVGADASHTGLADWSHLRVLVAEDDLVNQKVVTAMLRRFGIVPDLVGNGQLAVEACRRQAYDVVLLDVQMPVMDGLSAVRHLRASPVGLRPWVVALTANALPGDRERFLAAGMDDYVSKPVTIDSLGGALEGSRSRGQGSPLLLQQGPA